MDARYNVLWAEKSNAETTTQGYAQKLVFKFLVLYYGFSLQYDMI